ncbi:MAG: hypothetical protein ICV66_07055 [Chitinophagaceae bacterium]|nr:hypothetical protein [Chitinophagaceae bacterium]
MRGLLITIQLFLGSAAFSQTTSVRTEQKITIHLLDAISFEKAYIINTKEPTPYLQKKKLITTVEKEIASIIIPRKRSERRSQQPTRTIYTISKI